MNKPHLHSYTFPLLLVLYEVATYLSNDMYLPALPDMMRDLHLTTQQVQITLMIWFAGLACTPLIFGAISDRYGRRPVLLWGGAVFILSSVGCALANHLSSLLIARFIQGCMIPTLMVAGYASIHELYDHKDAIRILAFMGSVTILAPAFGPLLGSFILYFSGWREIFWVIAIWCVITIAILTRKMPETQTEDKRHPLHFPTLLKSYWKVLTNKAYMLQMCIIGSLFGGFIIWISSGSLLVMQQFHYSALGYGLFQTFIFTFYFITNQLVDVLMEKIGIEKLIRLGLFISLIGGLSIFFGAYLLPQSLYTYIAGLTIMSCGTALCFAPLNRTIIESSTESMGVRVAIFTILLMLFLAFASFMTAYLYDGSIMSMAAPTTIAVVLACLFKLFCWKN